MTIWKSKLTALTLPFIVILTACGHSTFHTIESNYSLSEQSFKKMGHINDQYFDVFPFINLENKVTFRVSANTWDSLTLNKVHCSKEVSQFHIQAWSEKDMYISFEDSYFINNKGDKVKIKSVDGINIGKSENELSKILIQSSTLKQEDVYNLWLDRKYRELKDVKGFAFLKIDTESFVGCPRDYFKLYLAFKDPETNQKTGYWIYFYPVQYRTFSY